MKPYLLFAGFGFIGACLLAMALLLQTYASAEARIGQQLQEDGIDGEATLIDAQFVQRLSCTGGTIKNCRRSDYAVGQISYPVAGDDVRTDISLSQEEFDAFEAGDPVTFAIVYLPGEPQEIEETRGQRLAASGSDTLNIIVLGIFGVVFAAIGGIGALILRSRGRAR